MKRNLLIVGMTLGLLVGTTWAADPTDQKIGQDVHQLKKDYQKKIDNDLRTIGKKMRRLEREAGKAQNRVKAGVHKDLVTLRAKKTEADRKFAELKKSTGDAWKDLRKGLDDAVNDLQKAVDDAADRMKADK